MGAIVVGLRPDDHKRLLLLAEHEGRRVQDLAGIYLEHAIRRAKAAETLHDDTVIMDSHAVKAAAR